MSVISIVHFNDVYRVSDQKLPGSNETINVTQFAARLNDLRPAPDQGLVLFSGDLFSPSVESTVTRGSHMVPVMNYIAPDVALTGNHDFDFGFPHLSKLVKDSSYPWLLSNVIDGNTGAVPPPLKEYEIVIRNDIKIGIIGLVEEEWIETVSSWPSNFKWQDMTEVSRKLSQKLRDPAGHACDMIIALTHSRLPNDINLAKAVFARPSDADPSVATKHGVDLLLGGHDHMYYVSKGCSTWDDYDISAPVLGGEADDGILLVKSGTDFRELSVFDLELDAPREGAIRRRTIKHIKGKRIEIKPQDKESSELRQILTKLLSTVSKALKEPLCETDAALDCRSRMIRTEEAAASNWFADALMHAFDDALIMKGRHGADGVLVAAGTFRGDSSYGPGLVTLGDIMEILPFQDPMLVVELDGETLWKTLENALATWPAQEGRFPVVSGFRVRWDSRKAPGERLIDISIDRGGAWKPIVRDEKGVKYCVVTREYMADGHDGYEELLGRPRPINEEAGQLFSTIIRRYLLGSQYIAAIAGGSLGETDFLEKSTEDVLSRQMGNTTTVAEKWQRIAKDALADSRKRSRTQGQDYFAVTNTEHMSAVDCFNGTDYRAGKDESGGHNELIQLPVISPRVDGRMEDVGRSA